MKNSLKIGFLFGFILIVGQVFAADQTDPIKDGVKIIDPVNGDQVDPNSKNSNENSGVVWSPQKKATNSSTKSPVITEEYVRKFSVIILNSFREKFVNTKRESFFLLPFSIDL
ncbi:MAG: hypothetical protein R2799_06930 [Crocinitomicaceae bacterium]